MTDIPTIQLAVAEYFGIKITDLLGKQRARVFSYPRMTAMYLCYQMTKSSYPEVGKAFGCCHTTVMHAVKWVGTHQDMRGHVVELWKRLSKGE